MPRSWTPWTRPFLYTAIDRAGTFNAHAMRNRDFIITSPQTWESPTGFNAKDMALVMARHNRVLFANSPIDRRTMHTLTDHPAIQNRWAVIKGKKPPLEQVNENLWVLYPPYFDTSINWVPFGGLHDWLNRLRGRRFASTILDVCRQVGLRDFTLVNDNDMVKSFYLKELLRPTQYVYYLRDYMRATPYWQKHGDRLEPQLLKKADRVVANSVFLQEYAAGHNPRSYYIGQGCDLAIYLAPKPPIPPDLLVIKQTRQPVIGYVGALLQTRIAPDIISHIAQQQPHWQIVLVGPEDDMFAKHPLHQMPNVHFLGSKPMAETPAYTHAFDVCINPQALNPMTVGNYPRKVDEYLACGKPVVATRTKAMEMFAKVTYLADRPEDYVALIAKALKEDRPALAAERRAFASEHSWENSVNLLYKALQEQPNE
jgi:teichuronic acid biosynthesis glycosyltransferase TuaH